MSKAQSSNRGLWTLLIVFGGLFGIFFVFAALIFVAMSPERFGDNQVGVLEINGPIVTSDQVLRDLRYFEERKEIKGIIVRIDSPGGSAAASQEIYEAIKRSEKKIVVSMGNTAASGGLYIACAGPKIFANPGTITGSIGVISQVFEVDEVMDYLLLKVNTILTGEYKDTGSPFRDFSDKDRKLYETILLDIYEQFVDAVAEGRQMERADVLKIADGRILTGRQAKEAGLVDELGGFEVASAWLATALDIDGPPKLVYPKRQADTLMDLLLDKGMSAIKAEVRSAASPTATFEYRYAGPGF